jgi:hypothetical protein
MTEIFRHALNSFKVNEASGEFAGMGTALDKGYCYILVREADLIYFLFWRS